MDHNPMGGFGRGNPLKPTFDPSIPPPPLGVQPAKEYFPQESKNRPGKKKFKQKEDIPKETQEKTEQQQSDRRLTYFRPGEFGQDKRGFPTRNFGRRRQGSDWKQDDEHGGIRGDQHGGMRRDDRRCTRRGEHGDMRRDEHWDTRRDEHGNMRGDKRGDMRRDEHWDTRRDEHGNMRGDKRGDTRRDEHGNMRGDQRGDMRRGDRRGTRRDEHGDVPLVDRGDTRGDQHGGIRRGDRWDMTPHERGDIRRGDQPNWRHRKSVCYNCEQDGHISRNCPLKTDADGDLPQKVLAVAQSSKGSEVDDSSPASVVGVGSLGSAALISSDPAPVLPDDQWPELVVAESAVISEHISDVVSDFREKPKHDRPVEVVARPKSLQDGAVVQWSGAEKWRTQEMKRGIGKGGIEKRWTPIMKTGVENGTGIMTTQNSKTMISCLASISITPRVVAEAETDAAVVGTKYDIIWVDEFAKMYELRRVILGSGQEDYTDYASCKCGLFTKCTCRRQVLVLVDGSITAECCRIHLSMGGVTVGVVRSEMDEGESRCELNRFKFGRYKILVMPYSEVTKFGEHLKSVEWLVVMDLPPTMDDFKAQVNVVDVDEKELLVTIFYDMWENFKLANGLAEILTERGQSVPRQLKEELKYIAQADADEEPESDTSE